MPSPFRVTKIHRLTASVSVLALTISLAACGGQQNPENTATKDTPSGTATDTTASSTTKLDLRWKSQVKRGWCVFSSTTI